MDEGLYSKSITCPVCSKAIDVLKVKMDASKVVTRDTDFCVFYEGLNPLFYDIWVCGNCGYAAPQDKFENVKPAERTAIIDNITSRWKPRDFSGERTIHTALESYKLALLDMQLLKAKASERARMCHRIAWMYRYMKDEKEKDFLGYALHNYKEAYEKESFPIDKLDEYTCMYIIGELNRRLGNYEDSVSWFSKIIGSPQAKQNKKLIDMVREQYDMVKDQLKELKNSQPEA